MKNTVVIYKSVYGATKKYAEWISSALQCDLLDASKIKANDLQKYDTIVFGGGLYASGISGFSMISKHYEKLKDKNIVVFTVGLADPEIKEQFEPIINKNFTDEMKKKIPVFHLRGGIDYQQLNFLHKSMMAMLKKMVSKKE